MKSVLIGLLFFVTFPQFIFAAESKEIKFKSRDLQKVKEEMDRKKEEQNKLKRETEDLSNEVKQSELHLKNVEQVLSLNRRKSSEVSQNMALTKNQHDSVLNNIDSQSQSLNKSLQTYYVASLLSGPQCPSSVFSRVVIKSQSTKLNDFKSESKKLSNQLQSLIETQEIVRNEVEKQESRMSEIKNSRENKERLLTKKLTRQEILQQELKELQQTAEELASLIEVLRTKDKQELAKEKQARLEKQLSGHSPILPHSLPWPIQGKVLTKYGRQQNAQLGAPFFSNGIVIGLDASSPVMAVADGKVLYAGQFMSYGAMTVLEHPGDWYTVYGYLSGWDVEKGQEIKKGQKIGTSRIKTKGGAETYFELRFYGKPTDPLPWLNQ